MATQTTLTLDQFLALPEREEDGIYYELSAGELITWALSGYRHSAIVINIGALLRVTIDRKEYIVVGGDAGFVLDAGEDLATVRGADVAVNRRESVGETIPVGFFKGSPLVAIEVISPSKSARDIERKIEQYLAAGSSEVWIVYPDTSRVYVYRSGQRNPQVIADGESFESVLGHRFAVSEFFQI
ncbi:MAG TPA: Uma2 family endonuclease [Bryobacteraceae bacterium]|jgi:Uma2 family endonuclease